MTMPVYTFLRSLLLERGLQMRFGRPRVFKLKKKTKGKKSKGC